MIIKKTYIPGKPRNPKLSTATGTVGGVGKTEFSQVAGSSHEHPNKTLLDAISQSNIDVLEKLSVDDDGNIKVDTTLWATGGISALGLGEGLGEGGGVDMLDDWTKYTEAKKDYYVPASLLVPFRNDTISRLTSLESGSATSIATTGSGNAITSISKSGSVITANKGLSFALSTHTHSINDITGLQGALDGKQPTISTGTTSQYYRGDKTWQTLNTSVVSEGTNLYFTNARVKAYGDTLYSLLGHTHTIGQITGLQGALDLKATQSDIDTAIDAVEIGGRNLLTESVFLTSGTKVTKNGLSGIYIQKGIDKIFNSLTFEPNTQYSFYVDKEPYPAQANDLIIQCWYTDGTRQAIINNSTTRMQNSFVSAKDKTIESIRKTYHSGGSIFYAFQISKMNVLLSDWTPAPEDQVTDWNETDVNSFAFLKNKPTKLSQFTDNIGVGTHIANKANPHAVTKAQVGLSNVDNTSDLLKPISTAVQTALNLKANLANPTFTGNVTAPTFIGALSGNASSATRLTTLNTYDANDIIGGATFNYTIASYWVNAPIGMGFGLIGNIISRGSNSLSLQLAADINHNSTSSTKDLWFRTGNNLGFQNDWKKVWHSGNLTPVTTNTTQTITGAKTFSSLLTASAGVNTPKVDLGNGFTIEPSGTELVFKYNGVIKQRMLSDGTILATGGITALSTE